MEDREDVGGSICQVREADRVTKAMLGEDVKGRFGEKEAWQTVQVKRVD